MIPYKTFKEGDVILTKIPFVWNKPIRYVSWAIRVVLNSWFNHIAIYTYYRGEPCIIEATSGGVRMISLDNFIKDFKIEVRRNQDLKHGCTKKLVKYIGSTGYDYSSLVIYQLIYQITGKWLGRKGVKASNKFYCSELYAYMCDYNDWWKTTPKDIGEKDYKLIYSNR